MENRFTIPVFLLDDNEICLKVYKHMLVELGYTAVEVFTTVAALFEALPQLPQVIFLDYNMDNLNGIEVLKKIRRQDPNILVVFISGQEDIEVAVNALKFGALDYLTKEKISLNSMEKIMQKVDQITVMAKKRPPFSIFRRAG